MGKMSGLSEHRRSLLQNSRFMGWYSTLLASGNLLDSYGIMVRLWVIFSLGWGGTPWTRRFFFGVQPPINPSHSQAATSSALAEVEQRILNQNKQKVRDCGCRMIHFVLFCCWRHVEAEHGVDQPKSKIGGSRHIDSIQYTGTRHVRTYSDLNNSGWYKLISQEWSVHHLHPLVN